MTITATGINKVYDGGVAGSVTLSDNRVSGDILSAASTASFADKNVATGKTVNVAGITVTGADAGNYTFNTSGSTTADITPRALTITATGINKVYDGGVAGWVTLSDNRVSGDILNAASTANFADKNVATSKAVNVSGITVTGADSGNYTFNTSTATTADITPKSLAVLGTLALNKAYDGTTNVRLQEGVLTGVVAGDAIGLVQTGEFSTKNAGAAIAVQTSSRLIGADADNYVLVQPSGLRATISPRPLNVVATGINKSYDGTVVGAVRLADDRIEGDVLKLRSASVNFINKDAGKAKPVMVSDIAVTGNDAANYTVKPQASTTADITPVNLSVTAENALKVQGEINPPLSARYAGFVAGENPSVLDGTLALTTTATTASIPGTYAIKPSGQTSTNYNIGYFDGSLQVLFPLTLQNALTSTRHVEAELPRAGALRDGFLAGSGSIVSEATIPGRRRRSAANLTIMESGVRLKADSTLADLPSKQSDGKTRENSRD